VLNGFQNARSPAHVQNQSGSVLYNYLLGGTDISLASPICNSLALVFTGLTARALGERQPWNLRTALGMLLIVGGVGMCVVAKANTEAIKQASIAAG
jgi:drug/metabolite transporter (DMT)-like permease